MTVTVTFSPGAVGSFNNVNLPITRNPANGASQLTCSGKAVAAQPAFTVLPAVVDFGHVPVGTTAVPLSFTIHNSGDVPIAFTLAGSPLGSPFQWAGFNGMLTCGQSQPIAVTFTPTLDGPAPTQIATVFGTPGGNKSVTIQGEGCIPDAVIARPPAPFPAYGDMHRPTAWCGSSR